MIIIRTKKFFAETSTSAKGSALIMALMATIGIAALSVVIMQRNQTEKKLAQRLVGDSDIASAMNRIASHLSYAPNCNATISNFSNTTTLTTLTEISKCASGVCINRAGATTFMKPETGGSWQLEVLSPQVFTKARIKSLSYKIITPQKTKATNGNTNPTPAIARIYIVFEKNIGRKSDGTYNVASTPGPNLPNAYSVDVQVVTADWNPITYALTPKANIAGCARSSSSTAVFGL